MSTCIYVAVLPPSEISSCLQPIFLPFHLFSLICTSSLARLLWYVTHVLQLKAQEVHCKEQELKGPNGQKSPPLKAWLSSKTRNMVHRYKFIGYEKDKFQKMGSHTHETKSIQKPRKIISTRLDQAQDHVGEGSNGSNEYFLIISNQVFP